MLSLLHDVDSHRTEDEHVDQSGHSGSGHWDQSAPVLSSEESRDTDGLGLARGSQSHQNGQGALNRKVDGKDG